MALVSSDSAFGSYEDWLGILMVRVLEGNQMLAMDLGGKSDPFCIVSHGPTTFRTDIIYNSLQPQWNQECSFFMYSHSRHWELSFSVYDYDKIGRNEYIGRIDLDPRALNLESGNESEHWLELLHQKKGQKKSGGRIRVSIQFRSRQELESTVMQEMTNVSSPPLPAAAAPCEADSPPIPPTSPVVPSDKVTVQQAALQLSAHASTPALPILTCRKISTQFSSCPVCMEQFHCPRDAELIGHLGICFARLRGMLGSALRPAMGPFLSEHFAARSATKTWAARIRAPKSSDDVCSNPLYIHVMDRATGKVIEEYIPTRIRLMLRSFYQTKLGRKTTCTARGRRMLVAMTRAVAKRFTDPKSVLEIPKFINMYQVNVDEILEPLDSFKNFNEFFFRKLKPEARPIACRDDPRVVVSPADCRCIVFPNVDTATKIWVKGARFSIASLLDSEALAQRYVGGSLGIFRLAPQDYHRFHVPVDGVTGPARFVGSEYYTVNPMAVRLKEVDVFTENKRVVVPVHSTVHGTVMYIAVGATNVASLNITAPEGGDVKRGDELGYFAFGGSTIILVFEPGKIVWDADLLANSARPLEAYIKMGTSIGRLPC